MRIRQAGQRILSESKEKGIDFGKYIRDKGQLAVQQLQRADSAYAQAIQNTFNTANKPMVQDMLATPLSEIRGMTPVSSYEMKGGQGPRTVEQANNVQGMMGDAALMASNFGVRYGLPGAGIALAAKGIGDVAFGGPSDQQEPAQIDMGQVAGMSALGAGVAMVTSHRTTKYVTQNIEAHGWAQEQQQGCSDWRSSRGGQQCAIGQALF